MKWALINLLLLWVVPVISGAPLSVSTGGNYSGTNQASVATTTSSWNVSNGNSIVCAVGEYDSARPIITMADLAGNAYLPVADNTLQIGLRGAIFLASNIQNPNGGTNNIATATFTGGTNIQYTSIHCLYYAGALIFDAGGTLASLAGGNYSSVSAPNFQTFEPSEITVGFIGVQGSSAGSSWAAGTGFTLRSSNSGGMTMDQSFSSLQSSVAASATFNCGVCGHTTITLANFSDGTGCVTDRTHKGTCWPSITVNVGDSLTVPGGATNNTYGWSYLPLIGGSPVLSTGATIADVNFGLGGQTCLQMQTASTSTIDALYNSNRKFNVLSFQCGINDVANNTSISAATVWGYMQTFINARIAVGWTVVMSTITSNSFTESIDPIQSTLNGLIKSNAATLCGLNSCSANGGGMNYIASDMTADAGIGAVGSYQYASNSFDGSGCVTPNPSTGNCPFDNNPHENNIGNAIWGQYYYRALVFTGLNGIGIIRGGPIASGGNISQ